MKSTRLWAVVALMVFTALVVYVRGDVDRAPAAEPLNEMPNRIDGRIATDVPLDAETLAILGDGFYLNRVYLPETDSASTSPGTEVQLYIAYLPSQRTGQSIHSPQNCLPGAGWTIESSQVTRFSSNDGKDYQANDNLIVNGAQTDEVLYWYQLHGRSIASDYRAKIDTLADSIRYGRTDEALIRVITPVVPGESRYTARERVLKFTRQVVDVLPAFVPN